jgi:hypothetical protein
VRLTATQLIPYPDPEDHGAGGRQLQDMAERLEVVTNAVDLGYLARQNPPSWIARRTSSQALLISFGETNDIIWQSVDVDNTGNRAPTLSGSNILGKLATEGRPETWWVGAYMKLSAGTILGSRRDVTLVVESFDPLTGSAQVQRIPLTGEETNSSGEHLTVDATVRVLTNATLKIQVDVLSGITVNVESGSFCWATRIGQE